MFRWTTVLVALAAVLPACTAGEAASPTQTRPAKCEALGAWSTWPEADWVREIVDAGGYQVMGETGSAIVASGKGHEFNIWATEAPSQSRMPNWRPLAKVRGVPIYGDRDLWRSWRAQGFTFWVQGASSTPAAGRLAPVVNASLHIPFRDECGTPPPGG